VLGRRVVDGIDHASPRAFLVAMPRESVAAMTHARAIRARLEMIC
jgi:hypothetical protein